jgi:hypothetical protein
MTHHLFTHEHEPSPGPPGRAKPTARRRWVILGTAAVCLCLAVAVAIAADTGHHTGAGTGASRAAAAARARSHAAHGYHGYHAGRAGTGASARSVGRAYQFLTLMLNLHDPPGGASAAELPTLPQSYLGGVLGLEHYTVSNLYDDALVIDAYLAMHTGWGDVRAERVGNALAYLQTHQPGRLYDEYSPGGVRSTHDVRVANQASNTGDVAWAGLALAQLYAATGNTRYLRAAVGVARWIQANCVSDRGPGGYTGGYASPSDRVTWKSTEHNIDVFALFRLLARLTGQDVWLNRAQHARRFVVAMWDDPLGLFDIGTIANGVSGNESMQAEDVNTWSYLALRAPAYAGSVGWVIRNLSSSAGRFHGVSVSTCDRGGVWFEGTAHLADALETLGTPADIRRAAGYLADIRYAQERGPDADGRGIMASSEDGLTDCEGNFLYASLHTGTTAWYILAAKAIDPLSAVPLIDQPVR